MKIYNAPKNIPDGRGSVRTVICITRHRKNKGEKTRKEKAYFISNLPTSRGAEYFGKKIRAHWAIENSLHYVKDVSLGEDKSKICTMNQPHNISLFRTISINLFRRLGYKNIAQAIRLTQHNIELMSSLIM